MAEQITKAMDAIRNYVLKTPGSKYALAVEEQTKINFEYFIFGFGVLLVLCIFFGIGASFITDMIGFLYPMYMTIFALESSHQEKEKWLIYWILFVSLNVVEGFVGFLIDWLGFYYPVKAAFLVYLMLPQYNGAKKVYDAVIAPHVSKILGDKVDAAMKEASKSE